MNTAAGAGDQRAPSQGQACSQQGHGRARAHSASPGTGDLEQGLPYHGIYMVYSDACNYTVDLGWLPESISNRTGSMLCSSVHPTASAFAEFYTAQDKQHFTKQTADDIRNLQHTMLLAIHEVIKPKKC